LAGYLGIPRKDLLGLIKRDGRNEDLPFPTFTEGKEVYADLEEVENWLLAMLDKR